MEDSRNMFALFEHNNTIDKAVESRVLVADVLAKFERWVPFTCICCILTKAKINVCASSTHSASSVALY